MSATETLILEDEDSKRLNNLCGVLNAHLQIIEKSLQISIHNLGNTFVLKGATQAVAQGISVLHTLYELTKQKDLTPAEVNIYVQETQNMSEATNTRYPEVVIKTKTKTIKGRSPNQNAYLHQIQNNDINFGIGPAGTGKTYLAVASAVEAFNKKEVERIILVRPAVEAGEKLGFLPGDLADKVDPYLRPLYDALYEMMGIDYVEKLLEKNLIEVAPLAFMRGRTLNNSFILLDEAQNTTIEQMKMFLTRLGFGSTAIITGDLTQVDLDSHVKPGLADAVEILPEVDGVHFTFFEARDVIRHPLVKRIVQAYDNHQR